MTLNGAEVQDMRKIIALLTVVVIGFAGYTVWNDPTVGPEVQAQVAAIMPEGITDRFPVIAGSVGDGSTQATGRFGGIGAANSVAGAVVGSVQN